MLGLRRKIVWLSRICHCRGFGVQSPWAYMIVRYIINEHYPYYAYEPLAKAYPCADLSKRKLRELCLRLANYAQPHKVVAYACTDKAVGAYIKAGCKSAEYKEISSEEHVGDLRGADFALISPSANCRKAFETAAEGAKDGMVVMLTDIYKDKKMRQLWREVVSRQQNIVSFDLYYCGLVFFDKKRFKQNYIINF